MLRQLAIRNVVLVEQLELEFEAGLGVLTGETGAGKSILLDALGLALGARSDTGLVRSGSEGSSVSAEIDLPADHPVHALLVEQGIDADPGEPLILRRSLKAVSDVLTLGPLGIDFSAQAVRLDGQPLELTP